MHQNPAFIAFLFTDAPMSISFTAQRVPLLCTAAQTELLCPQRCSSLSEMQTVLGIKKLKSTMPGWQPLRCFIDMLENRWNSDHLELWNLLQTCSSPSTAPFNCLYGNLKSALRMRQMSHQQWQSQPKSLSALRAGQLKKIVQRNIFKR